MFLRNIFWGLNMLLMFWNNLKPSDNQIFLFILYLINFYEINAYIISGIFMNSLWNEI